MEALEKLLTLAGINDYDELTPEEQTTYRSMLNVVQSSNVTLEDVKRHVHAMRQSVELELADYKRDDRKDIYMKARLRNYILFEALFERPQRAKEMLEQYTRKAQR